MRFLCTLDLSALCDQINTDRNEQRKIYENKRSCRAALNSSLLLVGSVLISTLMSYAIRRRPRDKRVLIQFFVSLLYLSVTRTTWKTINLTIYSSSKMENEKFGKWKVRHEKISFKNNERIQTKRLWFTFFLSSSIFFIFANFYLAIFHVCKMDVKSKRLFDRLLCKWTSSSCRS